MSSTVKRAKTVDVAAVLAKRQAEESALHGLVNVERAEEHTVDLGNLLTLDPRAVDVAEFTCVYLLGIMGGTMGHGSVLRRVCCIMICCMPVGRFKS